MKCEHLNKIIIRLETPRLQASHQAPCPRPLQVLCINARVVLPTILEGQGDTCRSRKLLSLSLCKSLLLCLFSERFFSMMRVVSHDSVLLEEDLGDYK